MSARYICKVIGDGLSPATAFRPAVEQLQREDGCPITGYRVDFHDEKNGVMHVTLFGDEKQIDDRISERVADARHPLMSEDAVKVQDG